MFGVWRGLSTKFASGSVQPETNSKFMFGVFSLLLSTFVGPFSAFASNRIFTRYHGHQFQPLQVSKMR